MVIKQISLSILIIFFLVACSPDKVLDLKQKVTISWTANKEAALNTTGGGYKVYYSEKSGFIKGDAGVTVIDMPYVSGAATATTTTINVIAGTYYIRVSGYSTLAGVNSSSLSPQISLKVDSIFPI